MSLSVNTNIGISSHRHLKTGERQIEKSSARLSSGLRINTAADDAAGMAISGKMKAQIRSLRQAERNVEDGIALIRIMDGGMNTIQEMMSRMRELLIQSLNDTNAEADRDKMQVEINQITEEITAIATRTEYNTIPLLSIESVDLVPQSVRDTFITQISGHLNSLGISPVLPDGRLNLSAGSTDGALADLNFGSGGSSRHRIRINGSIELDLLSLNRLGDTTAVTGPGGNTNWITEWDYVAGGHNLLIKQNVHIAKDALGNEFYDMAYTIENRGGAPVNVDFLFNIDTAISSGGHFNDQPSYSVNGTAANITTGTVFSGGGVPGNFDLFDTNLPNLDIRAIVSGSGIINNPDAVFIGDYFDVQDFNYGGGGTIFDSAYSVLWNNRGIAQNGTLQINTRLGVIDPLLNPELADILGFPHGLLTPGSLYIKNGANANQFMYIDRYDCRAKALGINNTLLRPRDAAMKSLTDLDNATDRVSEYRARAGAQQNRLEHTGKSLSVAYTNLDEAKSRIADADMAKEMMEFTKANIIQQSGMAMLAQARQTAEVVLQLLR
jgi:flagellin